MKRIPALVAASVLLLAACGRASQPMDEGESPVSSATVNPSDGAAAGTPNVADGPVWNVRADIPWTGDVPIWPLSFDETETLDRDWHDNAYGLGYGDWLQERGLPALCGGGSDAELPWADCYGQYLRNHGVDGDALRMYLEYHLAIYSVRGDGPVKVLTVTDWGEYGTTGFRPYSYRIATPQGIVGIEPLEELMRKATREAARDEILARILEGIGYWEGLSYIRYVGAPAETASGWTVPVALCLAGGSQCDGRFAAWFAADFTAEGVPQTARYLNYCWSERPTGWEQGDGAEILAALYEELPRCDFPEP